MREEERASEKVIKELRMSSHKRVLIGTMNQSGGLLLVVVVFLFCLESARCLRVDPLKSLSYGGEIFKNDKTGWRSVAAPLAAGAGAWPVNGRGESLDLEAEKDSDIVVAAKQWSPPPLATTTSSPLIKLANKSQQVVVKFGKLIEWDDDDQFFNSEHNTHQVDTRDPSESRPSLAREIANSIKESSDNKGREPTEIVRLSNFERNKNHLGDTINLTNKNLGANKLIYHGQIKQNDSIRIINGVHIHIDTHTPTAISRRSFLGSSGGHFQKQQFIPLPQEKKLAKLRERQSKAHHNRVAQSKSIPISTNTSTITSSTQATIASTSKVQLEERSNELEGETNWATPLQEESASSSNWKPIVVNSRTRRSGKTHRSGQLSNSIDEKQLSAAGRATNLPSQTIGDSGGGVVELDYKWRPITREDIHREELVLNKQAKDTNQREQSGFRLNSRRMSIEEPFEDEPLEDLLSSRFTGLGNQSAASREPTIVRAIEKSESKTKNKTDAKIKLLESPPETTKWKPVADAQSLPTTTTTEPDLLTTTGSSLVAIYNHNATNSTTKSGPATTTASSLWGATNNSSSVETAQRSASDLNYIYSSQPVAQTAQSSGSSYYSNYVMPPTVSNEQPTPIAAQIVDTSSGQTPEMIDRTPEIPPPQPAPTSEYSVPQQVASFQPVPQPLRPIGGGYGGGNYDSGSLTASSNFYAPPPQYQSARHSSNLLATQQVRQATPASSALVAPPVVRQEHHYHYYNQQQSSTGSPERQAVFPQQAQQQQQSIVPQQQTVIRELQPIMISQPATVIQQQQPTSTTTTPAPVQQIIREIIKEVPMQAIQFQPAMQLPRIIAPQVPGIPSPISMVNTQRDSLDTSGVYGASYAPAQRIIRQLSHSIPQVAIRIPAVPQFRLQMPAPIALAPPLRASNPASITRQTGSFVIPPMPKQTTTYMTETQAMPTHTTIMHTTQFTPATRTTVYTTDHQAPAPTAYKV